MSWHPSLSFFGSSLHHNIGRSIPFLHILSSSHLRLSNSKRFGPSSEQTPPEQGNLFTEVKALAESEQSTLPLPETDEPKGKKSRKPLSDKLPRHQVFAYLIEEEKVDAIDTFFVKVREEL
ncbi:MAG: transposase, partial [Sinobacterium sp.]